MTSVVNSTNSSKSVSLTRFAGASALAIAVLLASNPAAMAATKDFKIPKSAAITAINAYLAGFEVQFDNWGSFKGSGGGTWHTNNSFVRFPSGKKVNFNVPRSPTLTTAFKRYNAYVEDMRTSNISVVADGDKLKLRAFFESAGNEIKIGCINRRKKKPCTVHVLKHTGDINNAQVSAWFKPTFSGSTVRIVPTNLNLDFDLKLDSWILDKMKNVASHFIDIKGKARNAARSAFLSEMAKPNVRNALSKNVNSILSSKLTAALKPKLGSKTTNFIKNKVKISKIFSQGSNYVVRVKYPDIIHGGTVKIVSFKPKSKNLTAGCPFNFGFDAKIKSTAKVSGKAWLQFEKGKKSKAMNWKMHKTGIAKSTIVRKIVGKAGKKLNGKARLIVSWKGTTGITHATKTGFVNYKATCSKASGGLKLSN
ncbi:MAG: hypothetical protein JXQ99_09930 [Hyphomicrobiaceae bacterium]